jgi:UDP-glucose 4-epimerase
MKILVTGGAGYIGSHTVVELLAAGHDVVIIDNFCNSHPAVLERIAEISGKEPKFYEADVRGLDLLRDIVNRNHIEAVIHFAGLKAVGVSVKEPLPYYQNNIGSSLALCQVMQENDIKKLIFSSSATVYGDPQELPLRETSRTGSGITNPYGRTKYMIEEILKDLAVADPAWAITSLRYFNPVGAHPSGDIGEDPDGVPNNLLPYIARVAVGKIDRLQVFGNDYDTPDGTGIRDYIHVVDLAKGHVAALEHLKPGKTIEVYNLGTGQGTSVMEALKAFEKAAGKKIPYQVVARRPGDIASCYADVRKAAQDLNWKAEKSLDQACADAWHWQSRNPDGYHTV